LSKVVTKILPHYVFLMQNILLKNLAGVRAWSLFFV